MSREFDARDFDDLESDPRVDDWAPIARTRRRRRHRRPEAVARPWGLFAKSLTEPPKGVQQLRSFLTDWEVAGSSMRHFHLEPEQLKVRGGDWRCAL
jgi:hypothetical protein